jgi:hypothetical protein
LFIERIVDAVVVVLDAVKALPVCFKRGESSDEIEPSSFEAGVIVKERAFPHSERHIAINWSALIMSISSIALEPSSKCTTIISTLLQNYLLYSCVEFSLFRMSTFSWIFLLQRYSKMNGWERRGRKGEIEK